MKPSSLKSAVIFIFILLIIVTGCKKDKNDNRTPVYRMTGYADYQKGILNDSLSVIYTGNRIAELHYFYRDQSGNGMIERNRTLLQYTGNTEATSQSFTYLNNQWQPKDKYEITFSGENAIESVYSSNTNGSWVVKEKYSREFEGEKLLSSVTYDYSAGSWIPAWKEEFGYNDNLLTNDIFYNYSSGDWVKFAESTIQYLGDHFESRVSKANYGGSWSDLYKDVYEYQGDRISKTETFNQNGNWTIPSRTSIYTYDTHGNLETITLTVGSDTIRTIFRYEEGVGNYLQLRKAEVSYWLYCLVYPLPAKKGPVFPFEYGKWEETTGTTR